MRFYAEPDHFDPDPEPPPTDFHEYNDDVNTAEYGNNADREKENENGAEWETEENTYDGIYAHVEPEYVTEGEEYEDG
jgi:hypothetical protein